MPGGNLLWIYKKGSILGPVIDSRTTKDYVTIHVPVPTPKTDDRASKYTGKVWVSIWRATGKRGRGPAVRFAEKLPDDEANLFQNPPPDAQQPPDDEAEGFWTEPKRDRGHTARSEPSHEQEGWAPGSKAWSGAEAKASPEWSGHDWQGGAEAKAGKEREQWHKQWHAKCEMGQNGDPVPNPWAGTQ